MRVTASALAVMMLGTLVASCGGGTAVPSGPSGPVSRTSAGPCPSTQQLTPVQQRALAERYLAIADPANAHLDAAVDGFREHQRRDLSAAVTDLKQQASVERDFDRHLLEIDFPGPVEMAAHKLVQVNEVRADLATEAATSPTLLALASFAPVRSASDAEVEQQVSAIRRQLGLPPPDQG
jgi:hypothetical protein